MRSLDSFNFLLKYAYRFIQGFEQKIASGGAFKIIKTAPIDGKERRRKKEKRNIG